MCLKGNLRASVEEHYLDKAIGMLIPALSSHMAPFNDESLLATTVILRMSEQFSEVGDDAQHHLKGAFSLFGNTCTEWSAGQLDVRGVAFFIYLRESIRICFLHEQVCNFDMSLIDEQAIEPDAPDEVWTNRMTQLVARLCNSCWAQDRRQADIADISLAIEDWKCHLPDNFSPWCYHDLDSNPFPTIKYLSTWHGKPAVHRLVISGNES